MHHGCFPAFSDSLALSPFFRQNSFSFSSHSERKSNFSPPSNKNATVLEHFPFGRCLRTTQRSAWTARHPPPTPRAEGRGYRHVNPRTKSSARSDRPCSQPAAPREPCVLLGLWEQRFCHTEAGVTTAFLIWSF